MTQGSPGPLAEHAQVGAGSMADDIRSGKLAYLTNGLLPRTLVCKRLIGTGCPSTPPPLGGRPLACSVGRARSQREPLDPVKTCGPWHLRASVRQPLQAPRQGSAGQPASKRPSLAGDDVSPRNGSEEARSFRAETAPVQRRGVPFRQSNSFSMRLALHSWD